MDCAPQCDFLRRDGQSAPRELQATLRVREGTPRRVRHRAQRPWEGGPEDGFREEQAHLPLLSVEENGGTQLINNPELEHTKIRTK